MNAVEVANLARTFRQAGRGEPVHALRGISLSVPTGEVHGLLGPNGSGKTTLCKILSTVLLPSGGTAAVHGLDVVERTDAVRRIVGVVFGGDRGLYSRLSARQNLRYWAALYRQPRRAGNRRVDELLERVGLRDRADDRVETFSRGMKQRLHLARGLVGDPRVLVLDEPTIGMDPIAARDFRALVAELRGQDRTLLLTTHDMAEAEAICDRVTLIDGGEILGTENPRTIGLWISEFERVRASGVPDHVVAEIRRLPGVVALRSSDTGDLLVETDTREGARHVLRHLLDAGCGTVAMERPTLEEVYLHVMGSRGMRVP